MWIYILNSEERGEDEEEEEKKTKQKWEEEEKYFIFDNESHTNDKNIYILKKNFNYSKYMHTYYLLKM